MANWQSSPKISICQVAKLFPHSVLSMPLRTVELLPLFHLSTLVTLISHWSRTKRETEMRRVWRLTAVLLRLADHLYPFKDTTVSGETANVADGHCLIFLFIGSLRKVLQWFISVISSWECFFPPSALWPWDLKMNGFHLSIGRSHVGHGNGTLLWNANAKENLRFSSSQHKSHLWGSYRSERGTHEGKSRRREWARKVFCVRLAVPVCEICTRSQIVDISQPVLQTFGDLANEFTAIRVHYGIGRMSKAGSCNVLCVTMLR